LIYSSSLCLPRNCRNSLFWHRLRALRLRDLTHILAESVVYALEVLSESRFAYSLSYTYLLSRFKLSSIIVHQDGVWYLFFSIYLRVAFLWTLHYSPFVSVYVWRTVVADADQVWVFYLESLVLVVYLRFFALVPSVDVLVIVFSLFDCLSFSASAVRLRIHFERSILMITSFDAQWLWLWVKRLLCTVNFVEMSNSTLSVHLSNLSNIILKQFASWFRRNSRSKLTWGDLAGQVCGGINADRLHSVCCRLIIMQHLLLVTVLRLNGMRLFQVLESAIFLLNCQCF